MDGIARRISRLSLSKALQAVIHLLLVFCYHDHMNEYNDKQNLAIAEQVKSKYGIWIEDNGESLHGPEKPKHNGETPIFNLETSSENLFETETKDLKEFMEDKFNASKNPEFVLSIANKIVRKITNQDIQNSAKVIIMNSDEFQYISSTNKNDQLAEGGTLGEYNGIHYPGGLILIDGSHASGTIPLILHEVGHSFYEPTDDRFTDELRAMYFQIISTELFENELKKAGLNYTYGNYYETTAHPSPAHEEAWKSARALNSYITMYDQVVEGNENAEERFKKLFPLIKQPSVLKS